MSIGLTVSHGCDTVEGKRTAPRTDSATARILALLTEVPVMTTRTVERVLGVSFLPPEQRSRNWPTPTS